MVPLARRAGATVIIVNGSETALDDLAMARLDGDINARGSPLFAP
jgi:hypothetical protein